MATQNGSIAGSGYGNVYIDALAWGCGWSNASTSPITYSFGSGDVPASDSSIGAFTGYSWTASEKAAFRAALANYSSVCNVKFTEQADNTTSANIVWWNVPQSAIGEGMLGYHEVPEGNYSSIYGYFNADTDSWSYLDKGGYGYVTVIHEIGHAMGLAHPHDGGSDADATTFPGVTSADSLGTNELNQGIWTTMSYNDGWKGHTSGYYDYGWQGTLMAFDIAALQKLYGANMTTATGNNVYHLPTANEAGTYWFCIWDAAGIDTISNEGSAVACTIDLRAAPLVGANAGGYISYDTGIFGGFTIANGAVIENAIGGNGNDVITGNGIANVLTGGAGNDYLNGGAGADTLVGGVGNDIYIVDNLKDIATEAINAGIDQVRAFYINYTLGANVENLQLMDVANINGTGNELNNVIDGNTGNNVLNGNAGNDHLNGGAGNDYLNGGLGSDTMLGGAGNDTYIVDNTRDVVTELASEGIDKVQAYFVNHLLTANVENLQLMGTANINGWGNALNNVIQGNSANNVINGGLGNDTLTGGAGLDSFVFNSALNTSSNKDIITDFNVVDDIIRLENAVFTTLSRIGMLSANFFKSSSTGVAADSDDYILYNTTSGLLSYDADGNGSGASVAFAVMGTSVHPALAAADFVVI